MPDISKITLPSGSTYNIKDAIAREMISQLNNIDFVISRDAATIPEGVICYDQGVPVTGILEPGADTIGHIYLVPDAPDDKITETNWFSEYITVLFEGTYRWEKIGSITADFSDLGELAYKDGAEGSYTPQGTVSAPTFTGTSKAYTSDEYTPEGTVSAPTFTGTSKAYTSDSYTPGGTVSAPIFTGTSKAYTSNEYTPGGTVSAPTFTGTEETYTFTGTSGGTIVNAESTDSDKFTYTPEGHLSGVISPIMREKIVYGASSTTGDGSVTAGSAASATMPTLTTSVANETLTLGWTAGSFTPNVPTAVTLPTFIQNTLFDDVNFDISDISFVGHRAMFKISPGEASVTGTIKPKGTLSAPTFTGTAATISTTVKPEGTVSAPTFSGTAATISTTVKPEGTVSAPTFTGTAATISTTVKPEGTVSAPTFTGTAATIEVS